MAMRVALVHGLWVEVTGARVDLKLPESCRGPTSLALSLHSPGEEQHPVAAGPSMSGHVEDM